MPVSVVVLITHGKRLQIIEVSVYANNLYQPKGSDCSKHFASDAFFPYSWLCMMSKREDIPNMVI